MEVLPSCCVLCTGVSWEVPSGRGGQGIIHASASTLHIALCPCNALLTRRGATVPPSLRQLQLLASAAWRNRHAREKSQTAAWLHCRMCLAALPYYAATITVLPL